MKAAAGGASFDAWAGDALALPSGALAVATAEPARTEPGVPPSVTLRHPVLDPGAARRVVALLREARTGLLRRPAAQVARALGGVGERFLRSGDPLRRRALELLPATAGISPSMAEAVLDGMASDWTPSRLLELLARELGSPSTLDGFVEDRGGRRARALGFPFQLHVTAGTVPGVSVTSLVRALLVKGAVLVKPGRGDVALPVLFLRALAETDPELARAAAVAYWPGGASGAEDALLDEADLVVVYGSDAVVASVRGRIRPHTPMVAYHHRVSLGAVGREALGPELESTAGAAARAVALFDQRGCVSPHLLYVEEGGAAPPAAFARALAAALARLDRELPPGVVEDEEAAALQQLRGTAELRRAAGEAVEVFDGGASPWTVVLDPDPSFRPSCLNRTVRVVPVEDLAGVPARLAPLGPHLQTAAVAGLGGRREDFARALAEAGVLRVTSFGGQPFPPPWWHHDGRGVLEPLLRWTDLEE